MSGKILLASTAMALLIAAGISSGGSLVAAKPESAGFVYETAAVTKGEIRKSVATTGTVRPRMTVQVGSELSGRVKTIVADFNARVKAGDLLAVIEPKTFESRARQAKADLQSAEAAVLSSEAAVRKARSILANAEKAHGRQKLLDQKGIAAGAVVDSAERDQNVARAELEVAIANLANSKALVEQKAAQHDQAVIDLERTQIRSPIDGIVLHRAIDVGQTVAASFQAPELFRLAGDLSSVHIEAQVGEADIGSVRRDQQVAFDVDAYPKRSFSGSVEQIRLSPAAADSVVTYTVIIRADNATLDLFPGMTANVRIETARLDDVVRLPADAVRFKPPKEAAGKGGAHASLWEKGQLAALKVLGAGGQEGKAAAKDKPDDKADTIEAQIQRWTRRLKLDEKQVAALKTAAASSKSEAVAGQASPRREGRRGKAAGGADADVVEKLLEPILTAEQKTKLEAFHAEREGTERASVWVLDQDGQPRKQSVRIGLADGRHVELASKELKPGDEIVVKSRRARTP